MRILIKLLFTIAASLVGYSATAQIADPVLTTVQAQSYVTQLVNDERAKSGVRPVTVSVRLTNGTQRQADWLSTQSAAELQTPFIRTGLPGKISWASPAGIECSYCTANFGYLGGVGAALKTSIVTALSAGLVADPPHYKNIVDPLVKFVGVGIAYNPTQDKFLLLETFSAQPNVPLANAPAGVNSSTGTPETGWWWDQNQSGTGYAIEYSPDGQVGFFSAYISNPDKTRGWVYAILSPGQSQTRGFTNVMVLRGTLSQSTGGLPLTSPMNQTTATPIGNIELSCSDTCSLIWPQKNQQGNPTGYPTIQTIQRFNFTPNKSVTDPSTIDYLTPQILPTGFYWDTSNGGRGFFIEQQGAAVFEGLFTYRADGSPTWTYSQMGPRADGNPQVFTGNEMAEGGSQTFQQLYTPTPTSIQLIYGGFGSIPLTRFINAIGG